MLYDNGDFNLHISSRLNSHNVYGQVFIYNINPSYLLKVSDDLKVKFLTSYSTNYITPTGFQLYSNYGNKDLKPEKSSNFEIGKSIYYKDDLSLDLVFFNRLERNAIGYDFNTSSYNNLPEERTVNGFEFTLKYKISPKNYFTGNYSFVNSKEKKLFYRIPKNKFGFGANYEVFDNLNLNLKYNFTEERKIYAFGEKEEITLKSYGLVDLYAQYSLFDNKLDIFAAINNLTNEDFVSVYGYTTRKINFNTGVKYNF